MLPALPSWLLTVPLCPPSALLYMNADFEGGEFIFTEMDAKTVTVSQPFLGYSVCELGGWVLFPCNACAFPEDAGVGLGRSWSPGNC